MPARQRLPRAPLAALIAAAGLSGLLGGCGESAAQQFRDSLRPIQQRVQSERSRIAATLQAARLNDREAARQLDQEVTTLSIALSQFAQVTAPGPDAGRAYASYIVANRSLVSSLYRLAKVVAHGSAQQLQAASVAATGAAGAVQRSSDALDAALGP